MSQTQNQAILQYMRNGMPITQMDALRLFGCARLASRVNDLRQRGAHIATDYVVSNGKRFASYRLEVAQ